MAPPPSLRTYHTQLGDLIAKADRCMHIYEKIRLTRDQVGALTSHGSAAGQFAIVPPCRQCVSCGRCCMCSD